MDTSKPTSSKSSLVQKIALVVLVVVLIGLGSGATYSWQHSQLVAADNKVTNLSSTNKSLGTKLKLVQTNFTDLSAKYSRAEVALNAKTQTPIVKPTPTPTPETVKLQDDLTLSVDAAEWMNPDGTVTNSAPWFGVRMTLTNTTSSSISLAPDNFQLKDSSGNYYQQEGFVNGGTFPEGWGSSTLLPQLIAPGQVLKGNVIFPMPNKNVTSFTLLNDAKGYAVSASN